MRYVKHHGVAKPPDSANRYSNLGYGLLGIALSNRTRTDYAALRCQEVTVPLTLDDTVIALSAAQQQRLLRGYGAPGYPAHYWDRDALAGAGALHSTVDNMLHYLQAMLNPDDPSIVDHNLRDGETLPDAIKQVLKPRDQPRPGGWQALSWVYKEKDETYFHDGGTGAFSSCALFSPKRDYGIVVMMNVEYTYGKLVDDMCLHISQRLSGTSAVSLR